MYDIKENVILPPEKTLMVQIFRRLSCPQDASRNCTVLSSENQGRKTKTKTEVVTSNVEREQLVRKGCL